MTVKALLKDHTHQYHKVSNKPHAMQTYLKTAPGKTMWILCQTHYIHSIPFWLLMAGQHSSLVLLGHVHITYVMSERKVSLIKQTTERFILASQAQDYTD